MYVGACVDERFGDVLLDHLRDAFKFVQSDSRLDVEATDVRLVAILIHNVVEPLNSRLSKAELPA